MPARLGVVPRSLRAARIVHPFPTLMNVLVTGALGLIAAGSHVRAPALARLMLAMLAIQACIGIVNDLADLDLDAAGNRGKPLVQGALTPGTARVAALAALVAAALLSMGFGAGAWLLAMAGLGCGLIYDLRLKRTPLSGLPYLIALPLLPIWVWVALGRFRPGLLALIPLACLLGFALHLANALPDLESDKAGGARGLAQRLGMARALALCWGSFGLVIALIIVSAARVPYRLAWLLPGLAVAALALALSAALYWRRSTSASLRAGWYLLVAGSSALALSWLGALPSG